MHLFVTSKNVKWCHLIWPTLYYVLPSTQFDVYINYVSNNKT